MNDNMHRKLHYVMSEHDPKAMQEMGMGESTVIKTEPELLTPQERASAIAKAGRDLVIDSGTLIALSVAKAQLAKCKEHEAARIEEERQKLIKEIEDKVFVGKVIESDHIVISMHEWQSIKEAKDGVV